MPDAIHCTQGVPKKLTPFATIANPADGLNTFIGTLKREWEK